MGKTAFVFSGQGSQYIGMGRELIEKYEAAARVYDQAGEVFGESFLQLCFEGELEELSKTLNAQPAIFTLSMAVLEILKEKGITADEIAGFSLGEISACCCAGVFCLSDGFQIVKLRAEAMQKAAEEFGGIMYAILNSDAKTIEAVCNGITEGYVAPVNYNAPKQTVIAGEEKAVQIAAKKLAEDYGAKTVRLNVNAAFHSKMIQSASEAFGEALNGFSFQKPQMICYSDITGKPVERIDANYLKTQMISPVQWVTIIENMCADGVDTFIELGSGKTLCGLIKKINRSVRTFHIEDCKTLEEFLEKMSL
ncbi:ACP S-malonyltransferase [Acetivibrio sp. MSJd-27]|uniref:ACP S-malonyltransferase n=1 Tax=Acetivibrio sp. MSJd-27 TaxID=2841523 RepID=UPI001C10BEFE|nr:ACP S-malonyltransferase [Acetivibrio sp. MSJd-27]MBU5449673.1 ACP S-malonyltransferase [Acetivibrio sp. MSJd-27]